MRNIVLMDTENLTLGEACIDGLKESIELEFWNTVESKKVPFNDMVKLNGKQIKFREFPVERTTKTANNLDFFIVARLSTLLSEKDANENNYYILTRDKGFNDVVKFLSKTTNARAYVIDSFKDIKGHEEVNELINKNRNEILSRVLNRCKIECSTPSEVYSLMIKELRKEFSLSEIAEIYKSQKINKEMECSIADYSLKNASNNEIDKAINNKETPFGKAKTQALAANIREVAKSEKDFNIKFKETFGSEPEIDNMLYLKHVILFLIKKNKLNDSDVLKKIVKEYSYNDVDMNRLLIELSVPKKTRKLAVERTSLLRKAV